MTLVDVIRAIEHVASGQPDVAMIVRNDIFRLNSIPDARYGVFGWTQGQHEADAAGSFTYSFTFFYVDRLTADRSNELEVQSVGVQTLGNVIRALDERGLLAGDWTHNTFNQRFLDECAGVWTSVSLRVDGVSPCPDLFGRQDLTPGTYPALAAPMTVAEAVRSIEVVAAAQPSVNMIVRNDVFRLNATSDARYGVFAWTQGQHAENIDDPLVSYVFTLFYVDRLTEDQGNEIEVESVAIQTLDNVIRTLIDRGFEADGWTFTTFNQRFLDECAGAYARVTVRVPVGGTCAELFGDFNDDFNDDFFVY